MSARSLNKDREIGRSVCGVGYEEPFNGEMKRRRVMCPR